MVSEHHRVGLDRQTGKVGLGDGRAVDALDNGLTDGLVRQVGRLGVEGEVAPLQRTGSTHVGVITLLGGLVTVLGDDGVGDVDLLVGERLGLGGILHLLERDGVELRLLAPPLVIALDGQGLRSLIHLGGDERAGEPVGVRLLPASVEDVRVGRALLRNDRTHGGGPVRIGVLEGDDDVGVLVTLLHRGDLVETVGGGRQELVVLTVAGLPHGLVVGVVDDSTGVPLGLRVEMQGDDLLAVLGVNLGRLDVVRVRLRGAVLGVVEVLGADEIPDRRREVGGVVVDLQRVPTGRQGTDRKTEGATVLDLVTRLDVQGSQRRTRRRGLVALVLVTAGLVLLSAASQGKRAHGQSSHCGRQGLAHGKPPES